MKFHVAHRSEAYTTSAVEHDRANLGLDARTVLRAVVTLSHTVVRDDGENLLLDCHHVDIIELASVCEFETQLSQIQPGDRLDHVLLVYHRC